MAGNDETTFGVCSEARLYPLTTVQIGDIQSYISRLFLHVSYGEKKLVFFVDNRPWTAERQRPKSVELWQYMVTQSRKSPFANQNLKSAMGRVDYETKQEAQANNIEQSTIGKRNLRKTLFPKDQGQLLKFFRDIFKRQFKSVVSVQELSDLLHGCVTFELDWANVRGINYINELQTDTCVALEAKSMMKREFRSFCQALVFHGIKRAEMKDDDLLHKFQVEGRPHHCKVLTGRCFACFFNEGSTEWAQRSTEFTTKSPDIGQLKQNLGHEDNQFILLSDPHSIQGVESPRLDIGVESPRSPISEDSVPMEDAECQFLDEGQHLCYSTDAANSNDASCSSPYAMVVDHNSSHLPYYLYRDILVLFRFRDPILPLKLNKIITADQRLLKMLESGLPSWVIFLQSYPLVCKFYRPWMRPLAKTMYVLVSIITVIIGFYDLYKNVPVLKATAARICGPLFQWIEAWEMVSRIKYLGTMLFLQNCEKAFRWLLMIAKTARHLSIMLMKPMIEPLRELAETISPIWNICSEGILSLASLLWMAVSSVLQYANSVVQLVIWPFILLLTAIWRLVTWLLYPVFSTFWGLIVLPFRLIMIVVNLVVALLGSLVKVIQGLWGCVGSSTQLLSVPGAATASLTASKSSASTWRILWNDIFSQVFRAIRSIVNGFVAFFTTCNRHRLSIYNHTSDFLLKLAHLVKSAHSRISGAYHNVLDAPLLSEGGFEDEGIPLPSYCEWLISSLQKTAVQEEEDIQPRKDISLPTCFEPLIPPLQRRHAVEEDEIQQGDKLKIS